MRLSDSQNGFRAIRTDVLKSLNLRSRHTTIEQEMIVATLRAGYKITEVPTHEHARKAGSSPKNITDPRLALGAFWQESQETTGIAGKTRLPFLRFLKFL